MDKEQISEIVNQFAKTTGRVVRDAHDLEDKHIALVRGDGYWDLKTMEGTRPSTALLWLDFPSWNGEDILDLQLGLAAFLSTRLRDYFRNVKAAAGRSAATRRASANKAIHTRWKSSTNL